MNDNRLNLNRLANRLEDVNKILGETEGQYITLDEAIFIANTVYNANLNDLIDTAVEEAQRNTHILLSDAHAVIEAVEQYRTCPCKVQLRYVYQKHMKPYVSDYDYYQHSTRYNLKKIETIYSELCNRKVESLSKEVFKELSGFLADYEEDAQQEVKARLEMCIQRGRYSYLESITPEVIDMFMKKVVEISRGIIDDLAAKGITWKDPRHGH